MESGFLGNVVVQESSPIFKLLPSKDESLLIRRNTFLVLDLGLDIVNRIGRFHLEGDRFTSQCLDEDLHAAAEAEDEVKRRFLLDIIIGEGATVFELFACEDQTLLVGGDTGVDEWWPR